MKSKKLYAFTVSEIKMAVRAICQRISSLCVTCSHICRFRLSENHYSPKCREEYKALPVHKCLRVNSDASLNNISTKMLRHDNVQECRL